MEGWTFAAVALGVVLCFEFVVFRYFTPDRTATAGVDTASEPADSRGHRAGASERGGGARPERTVACEHCGTANADRPTVVFCRACLGRLD